MKIALCDISHHGSGLERPECAVAHRSGWLFVPCWTEPGGISAIAPDGTTCHHLVTDADDRADMPLRANGIALEDGGSFLIAHMGAEHGRICRLHPDGRLETLIDTVEGHPMPPANYTVPDSAGRIWFSASTTKVPRALDYRPDADSGFVALHADRRTRIVADGLGYANEFLLSADERTLWINETFGRRLTAFDVTGDGLANRRTLATFGAGTYPDGLAELEDGSILVTSIVSNRLLRVMPDGAVETVLEDSDPAHIAAAETAFQAREMGRDHLDTPGGERLMNISNIALAGEDRRTAYLGCLQGASVATFRSPLPGRALPHWTADIAPLLERLGYPP